MVLPFIMIGICVIGGAAAFFVMRRNEKNKHMLKNMSETTANEFINVRDICGNFLYTCDGLMICYLKLTPVSIDLYSKTEKRNIVRSLTAELSATQFPFKFIAVSRPVDISPLLSELSGLLYTSDTKQKDLLKAEIVEMSNFAMSGEVVERQFYISMWDKATDGAERDLLNRAKIMSENFSGSRVSCEILEQQEIVRLCNQVNNPSYSHLEDSGFDAVIPLLNGGIV